MKNNNLIRIKDVCNFLLKHYPLSSQEKWDQSGFVTKVINNYPIDNICVCLDVDKNIIDLAIKKHIKLIISHHPIFIDKKDLLSCQKHIINKIKKHHITVLSLHTCFDNADNGMNFLIATILQLKNTKWFDNKKRFVIGNFPKYLSIKQVINLIRKNFSLNIFSSNVKNKKFKTLAICAGAGISNFTYAFDKLKNKNYLLITGDVKYHNWQYLDFYKLSCLDVGHSIENCFVDFLAYLVKRFFSRLHVYAIKTEKKEHLFI